MTHNTKFEHLFTVPKVAILKGWILAIALACAGLLINELVAIASGHPLTVVSDEDLWSQQRAKLEQANPQTLVLLGASRMQTDIDVKFLESVCPDLTVIQLAASGRGSPSPVFKDLVDNTDFQGVVMISETESTLSAKSRPQSDLVRYYHSTYSIERRVSRRIRSWFESHLRAITPYSASDRLWGNLLLKWRSAPPFHVVTSDDRSQAADFSLMDPELLAGLVKEEGPEIVEIHHPDPEVWLDTVTAEYGPSLERFLRRGGDVIFVRMPVAAKRWNRDKLMWPVARFWDRFISSTGTTGLHFTELSEPFSYLLPDLSHIDVRDRTRFSEDLINALFERTSARINQRMGCSIH